MEAKNYKITCLKCKKSSRIKIINDTQVFYIDQTPIIAIRMRGDMNWGFECVCGNDSRFCQQEKEDIKILVQPASETVIDNIIKSLKIKDELKFRMESI